MSIAQDIADGMAEIEPEFGSSFTRKGVAYPCLTGPAGSSLELGMGGFSSAGDLVLNVRLATLPAGDLPNPKETIVFNDSGKVYRISQINRPPGGSFLQLILTDPTRGV